ncbi:Uncharacterised protein [Mycobacteroides abscessus subsp. abscessus]|nr:Uncharacterised protein [Mycobacteroides abscessus subsp. abscessus]
MPCARNHVTPKDTNKASVSAYRSFHSAVIHSRQVAISSATPTSTAVLNLNERNGSSGRGSSSSSWLIAVPLTRIRCRGRCGSAPDRACGATP